MLSGQIQSAPTNNIQTQYTSEDGPSTITGTLMDSTTNTTLPFPTVSVIKPQNPQKYILRTVADTEGKFEVQLAKNDTFLLIFESVGLVAKYVPVVTNKTTINLGKIFVQQAVTELEEMMVSAQRPLVKAAIDRITYDLSADPDAATSSTFDILNKVPLLSVGQDDKIQLKGSTKYKVYIDGRPSNLTATDPSMALKSIPASTVESIEVITEPGAKYDSEGLDGIINIVTKSALSGYMLNINANGNTRPGAGGGAYFTMKAGKFGMSFNGQYHYGENPFMSNVSTIYKNNADTRSQEMIVESNSVWHYFYGNLHASYEFDSLRLLSLSVGGNGGSNGNLGTSNSYRIGLLGDTLSSYLMNSDGSGFRSGVSASLDYQRSFKKKDQDLTFSYLFNYNPTNSKSISEVIGMNYPSYTKRLDSRANNNEHTFQVDYTEPFKDIHILEVGAKYILRQNLGTNTSSLLDSINDKWMEIPADDNSNLSQMQHIVGAYGSYSLRLKKWNFRVGARVEYMNQDVNTTDTMMKYNFFNVIPSVNISYTPAQGHNLSLGYTQRLSRPGIYYLNPFWNDTDPHNISQGNPNLDPEIGHSVSLGYGYYSQKININASFSGNYINNSIQSVSSMLSDTVLYTTYENIGRNMSAYGNIYLQWTICKWASLWGNFSGAYNYYEGGKELAISNGGWNASVYGGLNFSLPWKLKLGANGGYSTPTTTLQGEYSGWYFYQLSLKKGFLNNSLNISLSANNFAQRNITYTNIVDTEFYKKTNVTQMKGMSFQVSISYQLGKMKEQVRKAKKTIKNTDTMGGGNQNVNSQQGGQGQQ